MAEEAPDTNTSQQFQDTGDSKSTADPEESKPQEVKFECNICLDTPRDAVVSMCGHLFCWPCLHRWFETKQNSQVCPVCKSGLDHSKVVPIYGRGSGNTDPRSKIPPRPRGQRTEEDSAYHWTGDGQGGVQFSLGIGFFPVSFFASFFNANPQFPPTDNRDNGQPGSQLYAEEQFLSNIFMGIGIVVIFWLLFF